MENIANIFLAFLIVSMLNTGTALKCYTCAAKYGLDEVTSYSHGPCWPDQFNSNHLDTIECPGDCVIFMENRTQVFKSKDVVHTIFRGCAPKEGCDASHIPRKPGTDMDVKCCRKNYCNGELHSSGFGLVPIARLSTHLLSMSLFAIFNFVSSSNI